jgi:hypothetical protein
VVKINNFNEIGILTLLLSAKSPNIVESNVKHHNLALLKWALQYKSPPEIVLKYFNAETLLIFCCHCFYFYRCE